jgi:AmiR/NasT family two-component response regulator
VAALERTVAQLEHALAARVTTERAIGVLAERHGTTPRSAFEGMRREARSQGRPVAELAREVLDTLPAEGCPEAVVLTVAPQLSGLAAERTAEGGR